MARLAQVMKSLKAYETNWPFNVIFYRHSMCHYERNVVESELLAPARSKGA